MSKIVVLHPSQYKRLDHEQYPISSSPPRDTEEGANPFDSLRGQIEHLQALHRRLREMVKELEDLVK